MKRRKRTTALLIVFILSVWATGCGMKNNAGNIALTASGAGAEGAATGSAAGTDSVTAAETDEYRYCNDYHSYTQNSENGKLEQRTLKGKKIAEFDCDLTIAGCECERILFLVNDREILYCLCPDSVKPDELWSVPLDEDTHSPEMEQAQKVLEEAEGIDAGYIYADASYIAYLTSNTSEFSEYDREKREKIPIDKAMKKNRTGEKGDGEKGAREWYSLSDIDSALSAWRWGSKTFGNTVLLSREGYELYHDGVYAHRIGSGVVTKIDDSWEYTLGAYTPEEDSFVYTTGMELGTSKWTDYKIYRYDCGTGKNSSLVSLGEIEATLKKEASLDLGSIEGVFIVDSRLYVDTCDSRLENGHIVSCSLEGGGGLRYEKELSRFMTAVNDASSDYMYIAGVAEGNMLITIERDSKEFHYVWDTDKRQGKRVDENFYLNCYNAESSDCFCDYFMYTVV